MVVDLFCFHFFLTAVREEKPVGLNRKEQGIYSSEMKELYSVGMNWKFEVVFESWVLRLKICLKV